MSRFPPVPTAELTADEKQCSEKIDALAQKSFGPNGAVFKYQDERGALIGPFPAAIASKKVGELFMDLTSEYHTIPLPADAREVAILVTGVRFQAAYELYAHSRVAVKKAGISQKQVDDILANRKPADLSDAAAVAYDVAHHLQNTPGPLPQHLFDAAVKAFGKDGTLALSHFIGAYSHISILLNLADAPVPED